MATRKRLNISSYGDGCDSNHSLQKQAAEEDPMKKKKKKKLNASPMIKRIWNEDDELTILKGLVDYRVNTRLDPNFDWDGFFDFIRGSIANVKFSKEQLFSKIRKLRRKFLVYMDRINQGNDPLFTRSTDSQAFGYSSMIWGQNEDQVANGRSMEKAVQIENSEDALKEDEQVANDVNSAKKPMFDGKSLHQVGSVDKTTTNYMTDGKESNHGDDDDDLCLVQEAFETMILQGLTVYQKKLQLEKLMNLGTGKMKELSDEWKSLCAEEVELNIKKLRFSVKLVEAANDRM